MIYKAVRDFLIQLQEFWQAWSFAVSAVFPASFLHSADILPVRMMGFFEDHLDILLAAGDFEQSSPPKVSQFISVCAAQKLSAPHCCRQILFVCMVCFTGVTCRVCWCTYYSIIAGDKRLDAVRSERTVSLPMQHFTRQCLLVRTFWRITVTTS